MFMFLLRPSRRTRHKSFDLEEGIKCARAWWSEMDYI